MSQPERYVIGSGAAIEFEPDGTMRVSVSVISPTFDANRNAIARPNAAQALAFVRWLTDQVDIYDLDGWLKDKAEALRAERPR
ncbi:MAG: hypothetical protein KF878_00240 [Planctomycetes bacterium]|nr:hypothetical protein [Planctomycetota bacterium]